ncbi:MAG: hypothetical protein R3Y06_12060 [Faecalibacterium sp.]
MFKKIITAMFALAFVFICAGTAFADDLMLDGTFYLKQNASNTCTLSSATMMLRRRAYLDGDEDWTSVTESSVRTKAWSNGLSWNFTYNGMNVQYGTLSSAGNTEELIALLEEHPEGIVVYNRNNPHAVLLTDYTDGVFYCADPAPGASYGRTPFSYCTIAMSGVTCYWYIASDANEQLDTAEVTSTSFYGMFVPENLYVGTKFNLGGILKAPETAPLTEVTIKILDSEGNVIQSATDTLEEPATEWSFRSLNSDILFGQLAIGDYAFSVLAKNDDGSILCYTRTFTVSTDTTQTAYYWSANSETTS